MTVIQLVFGLVARDTQFVGIDDHDIITGVDMRREFGLMFAAQAAGDLGSDATQHLAGSVDDVPAALHFMRLGGKRFHSGSRGGEFQETANSIGNQASVSNLKDGAGSVATLIRRSAPQGRDSRRLRSKRSPLEIS
jgi:hypothetical protein